MLFVCKEISSHLMNKFRISAERICNMQQENPDEIIEAILHSFVET